MTPALLDDLMTSSMNDNTTVNRTASTGVVGGRDEELARVEVGILAAILILALVGNG